MTNLITQGLSYRAVRYVAVGGLAAMVNLIFRVAFSPFMPFHFAVIAAYPAGMLTAWILSRHFVFERTGRHWTAEMPRFFLVNLLGVVQVWLVSISLNDYLFPIIGYRFHAEIVAHAIGLAAPAVSSYFGHKHFSFARPKF